MRKLISLMAATAICAIVMSCGGIGTTQTATSGTTTSASALGSILGAVTNGQTLSGILGSVLGTDKPSESDLIGTWKYSQPGVAFTSENALAQAGGEAMATQLKEQLAPHYTKVGFSNTNTSLTLNQDYTFDAKLAGHSLNGTWSYDSNECKLTLKALILSIPCYAKKTSTGMSILMEQNKLLTLLQSAASMTGNSTLQSIGELSKNFDGIRIGFDMSK
ncbi:MAG: DUF4923 family protein [Prevotellaceae bacterium]|nr:DUF4923 family protein [Prevotellaceae bacterium]